MKRQEVEYYLDQFEFNVGDIVHATEYCQEQPFFITGRHVNYVDFGDEKTAMLTVEYDLMKLNNAIPHCADNITVPQDYIRLAKSQNPNRYKTRNKTR